MSWRRKASSWLERAASLQHCRESRVLLRRRTSLLSVKCSYGGFSDQACRRSCSLPLTASTADCFVNSVRQRGARPKCGPSGLRAVVPWLCATPGPGGSAWAGALSRSPSGLLRLRAVPGGGCPCPAATPASWCPARHARPPVLGGDAVCLPLGRPAGTLRASAPVCILEGRGLLRLGSWTAVVAALALA